MYCLVVILPVHHSEPLNLVGGGLLYRFPTEFKATFIYTLPLAQKKTKAINILATYSQKAITMGMKHLTK